METAAKVLGRNNEKTPRSPGPPSPSPLPSPRTNRPAELLRPTLSLEQIRKEASPRSETSPKRCTKALLESPRVQKFSAAPGTPVSARSTNQLSPERTRWFDVSPSHGSKESRTPPYPAH